LATAGDVVDAIAVRVDAARRTSVGRAQIERAAEIRTAEVPRTQIARASVDVWADVVTATAGER
jgi:hypothetical protein